MNSYLKLGNIGDYNHSIIRGRAIFRFKHVLIKIFLIHLAQK